MIYIKYKNQFFNENQLEDFKNLYPNILKNYRLQANIRIIKCELKTTLKDYPEIDIYIDTRYTKTLLGRFFTSNLESLKNYPKTANPFIILYKFNIESSFFPVYSLKETLLHEFLHFKQWLLNKKLKHDKTLPAFTEEKNLEKTYNNLKNHLK